MFYKYRKYLYGLGIVVLIILVFILGRATVKPSFSSENNSKQELKQHDNVNQTLEVKGKKCLLKYNIEELNIVENKLSFVFKINTRDSENVAVAKVMIKDEKNQVLEENPVENSKDDASNKIKYEVDLSKNNIEEIHIVVYAISEEMGKDKINLDEAPYNKSVINVKVLKQEMINKLKD